MSIGEYQSLAAEVIDAKLGRSGRWADPLVLARTRRYILAYDRWLGGRRRWKPAPAHYDLPPRDAALALQYVGLVSRSPLGEKKRSKTKAKARKR